MLILLTLLVWLQGVASSAAGVSDNHLGALLNQVHVGYTAGPKAALEKLVTGTYARTKESFICGGLTCKALLYVPKRSIDGSGKAPVIVMAHGLGGEKENLDKYASVLAENGLAVFSFDYRFWGESAGEPRRWISTSKQVQDWLSAIKHVQTSLSGTVDTGRLSLWGTSYGGGHALNIAAKLGKQVKSVIAQVPHLDGRVAGSVNLLSRGALGNALLSAASLADLTKQKNNLYVPLAGPVGSLAIMQLSPVELEAYFIYKNMNYTKDPATGELKGNWSELVTRASVAADMGLRPYNPTDSLHKVTAATLIIAGKRDELCIYPVAVAAIRKTKHAALVTYDCSHFDIYNSPWFERSLSAQVDFLKEHAV